jgi:subtilisin family serine protease
MERDIMKPSKLISILAVIALLGTALQFSTPTARAARPGAAANWSRPGPGKVLNEIQGATDPAVYLIQLQAPALAGYRGEVPGLAATNPGAKGQVKLDANSAPSAAYRQHLALLQGQFTAAMEKAIGHPAQVLFRYDAALNGLAVQLTPQEAEMISALPGVLRVQRDFERFLQTDNGPSWIGAAGIWNGSNTGGLPGTKGEGIVIGVIDSGINHDHPSFADPGPVDGYLYPARSSHFGVCAPFNPLLCNDKLIGMYDFTGTSPFDDNGHGSHTASTAGGNVVTANLIAPTITIQRQLSGVAPHANLISYKACVTTPAIGTCPISALIAAINQATLDAVDVINYSIGGGSSSPWGDLDSQAFLGARDAGVFVSASAGNSGPGAATVGSPADAPWLMAVGASTHDRKFVNALTNMTGGATTPPADMSGKSVTSGYGPAAIVYAGAAPYNNPLCNPFPAGTFNGEIVVCDRGTIGRVEKGQNVKNAGGGGMVLANDEASGDSLIADPHVLPAVHITYADGLVLKAWLASGSGQQAKITGTTANTTAANGDIMASFSSRGPNPSVPSIIKPDVTAPGVDIFAAFNTPAGSVGGPPEFGIISGTSMSSPHAAGAAALVRALHPDWTPAEVQSALMSTAFTAPTKKKGPTVHPVLKEDGVTRADPFDMGAGRIDLTQAARTGLVLNETEPDYTNADPASGGDPTTLNLASMADNDCHGVCTWTRVVESALNSSIAWTASTQAPAGMALKVTPSKFTVNAGGTKTLAIVADVNGLASGQWYFAQVTLTAKNSSIPKVHFPVAVFVTSDPGPDTRPVLHLHGNAEEGCTGDGRADLVACDGPFMLESGALSTSPAASWFVADPALDGVADRNIYDPNWVWNLTAPTTLEGPMTVEWWASCGACGGGLSADWFIRLWADGVMAFEQRLTANPELPNVPALLKATVSLPAVTANSTFVLHVDPVYIDSQVNTRIYYDSTQACPGASGSGPCDSLVRVPIK